ncbi:MAG: D-alanine--D-alanine ligase, partial [Clostridia bacterium]|nr:D-alanine--D-alanine ligase [Clostridia bacterium]
GGYSPERDVSLSSGSLIANALIERGHRVLLLDVYEGLPSLPADTDVLFRSAPYDPYVIPSSVPDLDALRARVDNGNSLIGRNVLSLCRLADKVFLALHGAMGENGQLQATLESYGILHTGSDYVGSLLAMDKDLSKRLLRDAGLPTPDWTVVTPETAEDALHDLPFPCVVKPLSGGSSVGISMVEDRGALQRALAEAFRWERRVLIEKRITGRELTVAILDGEALPAVEIRPFTGFYDYENKYQGTTEEICPAPIPREAAEQLSALCKRAFSVLRLRHYARFDVMMDEEGRFFILEANTLPGMTPTSLLPLSAATAGISYAELCERLVRL